MINKILAWAGAVAVIASVIGYGVVYGGDRKDIEGIKKVSEEVKSDTEQIEEDFNSFILKQSVYNESVAGSLNGINKILDKMNP